MSGVDERPYVMPECKCGRLKTWVVREKKSGGIYLPLMCVNVTDDLALLYGKWNIVADVKVGIIERAFSMYCEQCNAVASSNKFSVVLALFKKEYLDGDESERNR
jgi:hypothetical protein